MDTRVGTIYIMDNVGIEMIEYDASFTKLQWTIGVSSQKCPNFIYVNILNELVVAARYND